MLPLWDRLPTRRTPIVNYTLLVANVAAFVWMRSVIADGYPAQRLVVEWGLVPARLLSAPGEAWWTIFTSMFMHDPSGWLHLGGNMLFLWIFGDNVEDALGSARYAAFFLLCGVAAAGAQVLVGPGSLVPMVGASGAISGVLAAYGSLYPRSPITVLNPVPLLWIFFGLLLELPAWLVILAYFLVNLMSGLGLLDGSGGVAFFAHIGGFVGGILLVRVFMVGRAAREHERWSRWRPPRRPRPQGDVWRHRGPPGPWYR